MGRHQILGILFIAAWSSACGEDPEGPVEEEEDEYVYEDNSDLWIYKETLRIAPSVIKTPGLNDVSQPVVRVDAYRWSGFMGPTLVMEQEQRLRWDVDNRTDLDLHFEFPGLDPIELPVVPADSITDLWISSKPGPGVYPYRATFGDDQLFRMGIGGLVTVRDTCEWEPREIEEQGSILMMEPWYEVSTVNARVLPDRAEGGLESCDEDEDPCWRPFIPGEHTIAVNQRVAVNPTWNLSEAPPSYADCDEGGAFLGWTPNEEPFSTYRHGGLNEFQTISPATVLRFTPGTVGRLNFGSISHEAHTLSLSGLMAKDPDTGEVSDQVYLAPGQGTYRLWTPMEQVGEFLVHCIDHDHGGLDEVLVLVDAPDAE